jgi:ferric iron reductase protein FhuF
MYRRKTRRTFSPLARELAKVTDHLEAATRILKRIIPDVSQMEHYALASQNKGNPVNDTPMPQRAALGLEPDIDKALTDRGL